MKNHMDEKNRTTEVQKRFYKGLYSDYDVGASMPTKTLVVDALYV